MRSFERCKMPSAYCSFFVSKISKEQMGKVELGKWVESGGGGGNFNRESFRPCAGGNRERQAEAILSGELYPEADGGGDLFSPGEMEETES